MADAPFHHLIKKYSNRKLYDTYTRRYITLEDIARLVRDGSDITVVQRDTGEDLTPVILSQIVVREERRGGGGETAAEGIQERGQALLDYLRRTINMPAELVSGEVERRVGDVESLMDGALERALKRLSIPTRRDLVRLTAKMDALEARLESRRDGKAAVTRSAGTTTGVARRQGVVRRKRRTRTGAA